ARASLLPRGGRSRLSGGHGRRIHDGHRFGSRKHLRRSSLPGRGAPPSRAPRGRVNRPLVAGLALVGSLSLCCLAAPALTSWRVLPPPLDVELAAQLQSPSPVHWMGTDNLGRDVLSRILHGGRWSLGVALLATAVALLLGVPAGVLAGDRGGWGDLVLTRFM